MRRAVLFGVLAIAVATSVSLVARADDAAARDAQALFEEGLARVKVGNFEGARVSFMQAHATLHKPAILWNLALAEEKTGNLLPALRHFKQFAHSTHAGDDRVSAERHIAELMRLTGHIDAAAPDGTQFILDGAPDGVAPLREAFDVMPGRHRLEAHTLRGDAEAGVEVAAGHLVRVSLFPETASPPSVKASPAADGVLSDNASMAPATRGAPYGDGTPHARGAGTPRLLAVGLTGTAAIVMIGVAAYFGLQSQSDSGAADGFRRQYPSSYCFQIGRANGALCSEWNGAVQSQGRDATLSNVFYAGGGVLAAGAVAMWFVWPTGSKSVAAHLTPSLFLAGAGVNAAGTF